MSKLDEICARKRERIKTQIDAAPLAALKKKIETMGVCRGFLGALKISAKPAIIAEVKKASPSKGVIRADFNPVEIAKIYESSGAACLSVLTDEPYFQGRDEYLTQIKSAVTLPLLRKDFMLDEYQIYESRALGADCILLIMAALEDEAAKKLHDLSISLGMNVLVEVHNAEELIRAQKFSPDMIGVNNRNLKTLQVDIQTSRDLAAQMPDVFKIAESGIADRATIDDLGAHGYGAFLIGESFMREADIAAAFARITGK